MAIESQIIAYEAINELATEIAKRTIPRCAAIAATNTPKQIVRNHVLLALPANVTAISAYLAFKLAADALVRREYQGLPNIEYPPAIGALAAGTPPTPVDWITAISGFIGAAKAQTTQTSGTFTPVDQALYSDLERALAGKCNLVTTAYPGQIERAHKPVDLRSAR